MRQVILASGSPYRRQLLDRLGLPYSAQAPDVDETPSRDESPDAYVERIAREKAEALAGEHPDALIIGSDQAAVIDGHILGKPRTKARAQAQLIRASGRTVEFLTGIALLDTRSGKLQSDVVPFRVHFRQLDPTAVDRYLEREQPYDCAGSFKAEGLGIVLFERMEGDDPTALIGLPLIRLTGMLQDAGLNLP